MERIITLFVGSEIVVLILIIFFSILSAYCDIDLTRIYLQALNNFTIRHHFIVIIKITTGNKEMIALEYIRVELKSFFLPLTK